MKQPYDVEVAAEGPYGPLRTKAFRLEATDAQEAEDYVRRVLASEQYTDIEVKATPVYRQPRAD